MDRLNHTVVIVTVLVVGSWLGCKGDSSPDKPATQGEMGQAKEAKIEAARGVAQMLSGAYERWSLDHDAACPNDLSEVVQYLSKKKDTQDPWGNELTMVCGDDAPPAADGFGVVSAGPDGKPGTSDDIKSWER